MNVWVSLFLAVFISSYVIFFAWDDYHSAAPLDLLDAVLLTLLGIDYVLMHLIKALP